MIIKRPKPNMYKKHADIIPMAMTVFVRTCYWFNLLRLFFASKVYWKFSRAREMRSMHMYGYSK